MNRDIEDVIAKCSICAQYQAANRKEPLMSSPVPTQPWEAIASDLFEFRGKDCLVAVDYFSNFVKVDRLYSKQTPRFQQIKGTHGALGNTGACGSRQRPTVQFKRISGLF